MTVQYANVVRFVAEGDKVLAQNADRQWQFGNQFRQADWPPELAHVLAAGRARADMGQFSVFGRHDAPVIAAKGHSDVRWSIGCFEAFRHAHDVLTCHRLVVGNTLPSLTSM